MGEREAPDGEEEELPVANTATSSDVRVPAWIDEPPVRILNVIFKERALVQLQELGSEVVTDDFLFHNTNNFDFRGKKRKQ